MKIKLRIREDLLATRTVMLTKQPVQLGRGTHCDICLSHPTVSRQHAQITFSNSSFLLIDNGSRAGTQLNQETISKPAPLQQGDVIRLGPTIITVLELSEKDSPVPGEDTVRGEDDEETSYSGSPLEKKLRSPHHMNASAFDTSEQEVSTRVSELNTGFEQRRLSDRLFEAGMDQLRADFQSFWQAVKARTPVSLVGEMDQLRNAVDCGIEQVAGIAISFRESRDRLAKLLEATRVISAPLPLRERLEAILDLAIGKLDADSGFLMLYSQRRHSLRLILQRGTARWTDWEIKEEDKPDDARADEMMAHEALRTGATQFSSRAKGHKPDAYTEALAYQGLHGAICAPMRVKHKFLGLVYVDFRSPQRLKNPLKQEDADWLDSLSSISAMAIENARLIEQGRKQSPHE